MKSDRVNFAVTFQLPSALCLVGSEFIEYFANRLPWLSWAYFPSKHIAIDTCELAAKNSVESLCLDVVPGQMENRLRRTSGYNLQPNKSHQRNH
jgi:hypothetical protein